MSRIAPVAPGTGAAAAIEQRLLAARGEVSPLYSVLMNSMPLADGWEYFMTIVRQKLSLSPRLREMMILRIAVLNGADYEFEAHRAHALKAGLSDTEIAGLHDAAPAFDGLEAAALDYCDAMTRDVRVDAAIYDAVADRLDPTAMVELTATIAAYNMVSRLLAALDIR